MSNNAAAASNAALYERGAIGRGATHASSQSKPAKGPRRRFSKVATAAVKTTAKSAAKPAMKVAAQKAPGIKTQSLTPGRQRRQQARVPISTAPAPRRFRACFDAECWRCSGSDAPDGAASDDSPSKWNANGQRDPFISPVVSHAGDSGCSTGKKCLEIGAINLRGVVHAENGFIAVVSNGLNKAYFLRENDPVFNGYVMKITGDSIIFQETLQDRLGKTLRGKWSRRSQLRLSRSGRKDFEEAHGGRNGLAWGDREMRKQLLGLIVPLLAFVLIAAAADTTRHGGGRERCIAAARSRAQQRRTACRIQARALWRPAVTTLAFSCAHRRRLSQHCYGDRPAAPSASASDGVKGLRIGMDGQGPPNTRVVVDLDRQPGSMKWWPAPMAVSRSRSTMRAVAQRHSSAEKTVAANAAPKLVPVSATVSVTPAPAVPVPAPALPAVASQEPATIPAAADKPTDFAVRRAHVLGEDDEARPILP